MFNYRWGLKPFSMSKLSYQGYISKFHYIRYFPHNYPMVFGMGIGGLKTGLVDFFVQYSLENQNIDNINWERVKYFTIFGTLYLGGFQYLLYVPFFGKLFPNMIRFSKLKIKDKMKDNIGISQSLSQVFIDQFVHHPFIYFPVFYVSKQLFMSNDKSLKSINCGIDLYKNNLMNDLGKLWKLWIPFQLFNFIVNPLWMRVPFTALVSVVWTGILSFSRGGQYN